MADLRQRAPRQIDRDYKGYVAKLACLPCLIDGPIMNRQVQVAHLSIGSLEYGKRPTGGAEKASDRWCLPACADHHQGNARAVGRRGGQHEGSEVAFLERLHVDPFAVCVALYKAFKAGRPGLPVIIHYAATARREKFG